MVKPPTYSALRGAEQICIFFICMISAFAFARPTVHLSVHMESELQTNCAGAHEPTEDMLKHQLRRTIHHPDRDGTLRKVTLSELQLSAIESHDDAARCPTSMEEQENSADFSKRTESPWWVKCHMFCYLAKIMGFFVNLFSGSESIYR